MATDILDRYRRDALGVEVRWATWELTVFEVSAPWRDDYFVAVPRRRLDRFLADLWSGALDRELWEQFDSPKVRRQRLGDGDAVRDVTVVGSITDPALLPPAERSRHTGRIGSDPPRGRRHKRENRDGDQPRGRRAPKRPHLGLTAGIVAVVVVVAAAVAFVGRDDPDRLVTGDPSAPVDVGDQPTEPDGPTVAPGTILYYEITATVEDYRPSPESEGIYSDWAVGDTKTFWITCGVEVIMVGDAQPTARCMPEYARGEVPVLPFDVEGLAEEGRVSMAQSCTANDPRPQIEVEMDGYGSDTISGTYEQSYPDPCPAGARPWPEMVVSFTGRAVDEASGGDVELNFSG